MCELTLTHSFSSFLLGVISFGIGCGEPIPAVYTKVSTSLLWIRKIIEMDDADVCSDTEGSSFYRN